MKFLISILIFILLASTGAYAGSLRLTLTPIFTNQLKNSLGASDLNKASAYFDVLTTKWGYPSVSPVYVGDSKVITNIQDLIPTELLVVPNALTIRTSQTRGSLYDGGRKESTNGIPPRVTTNPANDAVFVYALNKDSKLIYPLAKNPDGSGFVRTYETLVFGTHFNQGENSQPIVAAIDVDDAAGGYGSYDPDSSTTNPPWALMVRARTPGQYQIHIVARVNSLLVPYNLPEKDAILASVSVARADAIITAVDGPELIDALIVRGAAPQQPCISSGKACLSLQQGESINLSATGLVFVRSWDDNAKKYSFLNRREVALQRVTWRYDEMPMLKPNPNIVECVSLTTLSPDGSSILLTAGQFQPKPSNCRGTLTIEGHGRMFEIDVNVYQ